jgi:hypothetical protein
VDVNDDFFFGLSTIARLYGDQLSGRPSAMAIGLSVRLVIGYGYPPGGKTIALRRIAFVGWTGKRPPQFCLCTTNNPSRRSRQP